MRPGAIGTTLAAALVATAWVQLGCSSATVGAEPPPPPRASVVRTVAPVRVPGSADFASHLYVERDVAVTARETGLVDEVLVERGQSVKRGQPLAVLERDVPEAELRMAEQELRFREAEFARASTLHDDQIVSSEERLRKEIERDMTATEVDLARARLEHCTIRAPFDGTVVERTVVAGQRVGTEEGTSLFRIVARDPLRARVYVPEATLSSLARGGRAEVEPEGGRGIPARIVFVGQAVDPASGTVPVIVELAGHDSLRVGAAATVRFESVHAEPLFRVPRETVREARPTSGSQVELLLAREGRVERRTVELVEVAGSDLVVRGAVADTDRVIFAPSLDLAPGQPIEVREGPGP
jgi:membrane fusion protein, multidrug efflux system